MSTTLSSQRSQDSQRFNYTARDARGEMTSGQITADSESSAAKRLQAMGMAPLTIRPVTSTSLRAVNIGTKRVKPKDLALFSRQFGTMIAAGLPIVRAVHALSAQTDHPTLKQVLPAVQSDLERGNSLSTALARHPRVFPPLMIGMVSAGEVSGSLSHSLDTVATTYTKEAQLRSKVVAAMLYPTIVLGIAVLMVIGMLIFVVPRFTKIFAQLGGQLPLPTRILVAVSDMMVYILPISVVLLVAFMFWWRKNKNTRRVREVVDPLKFRIPIFGKFFQKVAIARFARSFASLLESGVPMLQTLDIVSTTSGSIVIGDSLQEIKREVAGGRNIAQPMEKYDIFPPLVVQMVATGEETGALPDMLQKISEFYESEVDTAAEGLSSILEPILIVLLAGVVGGMVVALYLPMFKVYDLIK